MFRILYILINVSGSQLGRNRFTDMLPLSQQGAMSAFKTYVFCVFSRKRFLASQFICNRNVSFQVFFCFFGWSRFFFSVFLLFLFLVAMSGRAASPIFSSGSSSVYPVVPKWPKIYKKIYLLYLMHSFILSYESSLVCSNI